MTKYILHGGHTRIRNEKNKIFFNEITKGLENGANILLIYFAKEKEKHQELYEDDKLNFKDNCGKKELSFILATEENFIEEIKKANAVYMRGGDTFKLLNFLKKFPEFNKLIKDKVVAGSSAGAYVLAEYFYTHTLDSVEEGLGILPIKVIAHYSDGETHEKIVDKLEKTGKNLEVVKLLDFESRILYGQFYKSKESRPN